MIDDVLVIIDPGHGGWESGAVAFGRQEKDYNLQVGLELRRMLQVYFKNVLMTREDDSYFDLMSRAGWVSDKAEEFIQQVPGGKTICLSVHFNAMNGTARGCETIRSIYAKDDLAMALALNICKLGIQFRKVYSRESESYPGVDYYAMHRATGKAQTVIIESLFMDNAEDMQILSEPTFFAKLARKQADGLLEYLGISLTAAGNTPPAQAVTEAQPSKESPPVDPSAEVQQEHWAKKANDELKAAGFIQQDHTDTLDDPASEGMVLYLANKLRNEMHDLLNKS